MHCQPPRPPLFSASAAFSCGDSAWQFHGFPAVTRRGSSTPPPHAVPLPGPRRPGLLPPFPGRKTPSRRSCSSTRCPTTSVDDSAARRVGTPAPALLPTQPPKREQQPAAASSRGHCVSLACYVDAAHQRGDASMATRPRRGTEGLQPVAHRRSTSSCVGALLRRAGARERIPLISV
jgi:hypothetical protein